MATDMTASAELLRQGGAGIDENANPAESLREIHPLNVTRKLSPRRKLAAAIAGATLMTVLSGAPISVNSNSSRGEGIEGPASAPALVVDNHTESQNISPVDAKKSEIEQRYQVKIDTMQEAYKTLGITLSPEASAQAGAEWTQDELAAIDNLLAFSPSSLTEPINGVPLTIFIGNIHEVCSPTCNGIEYTKSGIVGLQKEMVTTANQAQVDEIGDHELTHRLMELTGNPILPEVNSILGDMSFLNLPEFKLNADKRPSGDNSAENQIANSIFNFKPVDTALVQRLSDQETAMGALYSFRPASECGNFREGLAGISQLYVKGEERFLEAFGPPLEGKSYDNTGSDYSSNISELSQKYRKAEELYKLYQNQVFGGKTYNPQP